MVFLPELSGQLRGGHNACDPVHVVSSPAAALLMVRRCLIHTVFITYDSTDDMRGLMKALYELEIPHVLTCSDAGKLASELPTKTPSASRHRESHLTSV